MTHFTKNAEPGYIVRRFVKHRTLQTFKVNSSTSSIMAAAVKLEYLVEWDGYEGQEEYTWEPHCTLAHDVPILVQEYRRKHNLNLTSSEPLLLPFPPNPGQKSAVLQKRGPAQEYQRRPTLSRANVSSSTPITAKHDGSSEDQDQGFESPCCRNGGWNQMSCSAVPKTRTGGEESTLWRLAVVSGEMSSELAGKNRCATDASHSFRAKKVVAAGPKVDKAEAAAQGPRGEAGGEKLEIKGKKEAKTMVPGFLSDGTAVGFVWPPKHRASAAEQKQLTVFRSTLHLTQKG
jgi:hypothetical protein